MKLFFKVCTYADLYPDAEEEDKRLVQCIELIDPNVNIASIWFRQNECDDEDEANNEDDEDGGGKLWQIDRYRLG